MPVITTLDDMDEDMLVRILKEPKNAVIKQYQKLFSYDGADLEFEEDALREIARLAVERKTGARGLRSIVENVLKDVMFELPSKKEIEKCIVTKDAVTGKAAPLLVKKQRKKAG